MEKRPSGRFFDVQGCTNPGPRGSASGPRMMYRDVAALDFLSPAALVHPCTSRIQGRAAMYREVRVQVSAGARFDRGERVWPADDVQGRTNPGRAGLRVWPRMMYRDVAALGAFQ
jgi:hypothetical protein